MSSENNNVTDEMVDDYIAEQYLEMRQGKLGGFVTRLLAMGEEAEALGKGGDAAITAGIRAAAKWEIEQQ